MMQNIRKLMSLGILATQIFVFWLAVGYGSFFFIMSFPLAAHDLTPTASWAIPHEQLFLYAEVITIVSMAIGFMVWRVQQQSKKIQLIRLYRQRNEDAKQRQNLISK